MSAISEHSAWLSKRSGIPRLLARDRGIVDEATHDRPEAAGVEVKRMRAVLWCAKSIRIVYRAKC
jgi:hypothetical protein